MIIKFHKMDFMDNLHCKMLDSIENARKILEQEYLFLPVVLEEDLKGFENKFKVTIPEDYRYFLLNVANGIVNKNKWGFNIIEEIDFKDFFYEENEFNPSLPFELTDKVVFSSTERKDSYPYKIIYDVDDQIFDKGYSNGQIHIAGYGCGTSSFIVVNGSEYGNIWTDNFSSYSEVYPEYDLKKNKPRLSFAEWFLNEIDRHIMIYHQNIQWENRIKAEEKSKEDKIDQQNRELEIKRLDQIKREEFAQRNKEIEREQQMTFKDKKPRRDLLTYLIDKLFH
ncbi:SMI1/KNR4 family protein [Flavobacterium ustbae]|uniref:SMI1/KNR4 family protein n=1 Tax=Flavobacterium ustbae TaxID=2488790 RepID=UPI000F791373|nr:SMI1/KNR4 family protein [Flavobacterium ustbae]